MKAPISLQRGMACLCCRKRKMKCDGARPVCSQCSKAKRAPECQYYEKKRTSRTQLLQAKITKLEARLRELEAEAEQSPTESSPEASSSSSPPPRSLASQHQAASSGFDAPAYSSDLGQEYFLDNTDIPFPSFDDESFIPNLPHVSGWTGDDLDFSPAVPELLTSSPSNSSMSSLHGPVAGPSTDWWENDVFCENKQILLDIFLSHRGQCAFDVHVGRFKASLLLPSARTPHPSLVDACLLLGCFFSRSPPFTALEPHFLKRTLRGITDALQHSDRIVHVLQASCLLALYFFWHGRTLEGYYHSSISARLALGLGLHQIRSKEWFQYQFARATYQSDVPAPLKASVPLSPPADEVEYAERIAAWWQIFTVDRSWAVAAGLPTALPDDEHPRSRIETVWPVQIPDDPEPTMDNTLIQPFPGSHLSGSSALGALRPQVVTIFERTARFSASSPSKDGTRYSLELSLSQFSSTLSNMAAQQQYSVPYDITNAYIVSVHTLVYAATIHLYRDSLETHDESYRKCLWAANSITAQTRALTGDELYHTCPIIANCWRSAADVYLRILAKSHGQPPPPALDFIEQQLDTLIAALQHQSRLFPMAGIYAAKTREEKAVARRTYSIATI